MNRQARTFLLMEALFVGNLPTSGATESTKDPATTFMGVPGQGHDNDDHGHGQENDDYLQQE